MKKTYYKPNSKIVAIQWESVICVSNPTQAPTVDEEAGPNAAPRIIF